jgi:arginyl-tRNA synthetase
MSEPSPDRSAQPARATATTAATPLESLREQVLAAVAELGGEGARSAAVTLERPPRAELGDYSTNAALVLAPGLGQAPRALAEQLGELLARDLGADLQRFEVAGPGFLNLFLADSWLLGALAGVLAAGESFGGGGAPAPQRILVEFVSANPTGPMHVGHARNAAYGDALARVLAFHGHEVEREFYVNDAGSQVRKLGESIAALARGEEVAEDGYKGAYVAELASEIADAGNREPAAVGGEAVAIMLARIGRTLEDFRVSFDSWSYESALHTGDPSPVARALALLEEHGHTYKSEGALWLRTSDFGDDKDRVLVRSSGEHTYFASDIAYHQDKRERGFERQIDVWGADHHGYVRRMKAAYSALGGDPEELELLIMQLVHLLAAGERAQMSKRAGEFVTLAELVAEVGVDAARWYLLARSHDTTVELDLDLARQQSNENPVYYVQYAHARIASILAKAGEERVAIALAAAVEAGSRREPLHATERALIELLLAFAPELADAAARRAPHRIAAYALELAQGFTAFYRDCRVLGVEEEEGAHAAGPARAIVASASDGGAAPDTTGRSLEDSRIALCVASKLTIARCLQLLGVSAPQEM